MSPSSLALKDRPAASALSDVTIGDPLIRAVCLDTGRDPSSGEYLDVLNILQDAIEKYPAHSGVSVAKVLEQVPGVKSGGAVVTLLEQHGGSAPETTHDTGPHELQKQVYAAEGYRQQHPEVPFWKCLEMAEAGETRLGER
jgi:hypothetical protein